MSAFIMLISTQSEESKGQDGISQTLHAYVSCTDGGELTNTRSVCNLKHSRQ